MPRATAMHAAAIAKKRKCKNCNMCKVLFSHNVHGEAERDKPVATAKKSVLSRQNPGNERDFLGGMRCCSNSSTVTASSVDSVAGAIRSSPSLMSSASDWECDSGQSGASSRRNSVSGGGDAAELDQRVRASAGNLHSSEDGDRYVDRRLGVWKGSQATELSAFDEVAVAEMENALNVLLLEDEEVEETPPTSPKWPDDAYLQSICGEQIEEWYGKAHRMAELIVCSCVEEPGTKFIDNLPEFAEAMHVHDDSDNFRLVLGNMADRLCDDNDDKKKLINKRNPAGFAIPFLDQNIGILRSITQLFSVRNPPRGDHSEVAVLQEARERMRQTKGHVLAVLLGEAVAEGGVVWAEGARAARIIEDVIDVLQTMFTYFFALIYTGDIEGLTLAHMRAREEILPMLETTLEEDTWWPTVYAPICSDLSGPTVEIIRSCLRERRERPEEVDAMKERLVDLLTAVHIGRYQGISAWSATNTFTPLERCFMRESDYRAKTSLLHIHQTRVSLTERSGSSTWHSLHTQEHQWNRIEYLLTVHVPSATFAPGGSYLTTERQCREFMGNAPNSLAYTAVAYSMLVRKVFAIVAATERGNFQALDAVQMIREAITRRNFKPNLPLPSENDDNDMEFFTVKFLTWAKAAGVVDSSDAPAKPASKERAKKKGKMKKKENQKLPPTDNLATCYSDTEEEANFDNLQFSHGVCRMVANRILGYTDPARYSDILESELEVCYAPSDDRADQFIDDDDDTFNIPGAEEYFALVDPVNETCCRDVLEGGESIAIFDYMDNVCPHHEGNHFTCCIDFYEYCVAARNPLYRCVGFSVNRILRLAVGLEALGKWVRSNRLEESLVCDNCFMPVPKEVINLNKKASSKLRLMKRNIQKNKNRNGTVGSSSMNCVCVGKSWVAQISESLSTHFITTLSEDFSRISSNPTVVHKADVSNQVFAVHLFHDIACKARRVFEKIVTLVDRGRVEDGTGRECGGTSSEAAPQVELPERGGSPFSLATGCWRPVDKVLSCERLLGMARFVFLQFGPFVFVSTNSMADQFSTAPEEEYEANGDTLLWTLSHCKDVWLKYSEKMSVLDGVCEEEIALEMLANIHRQSEKEFFTHQSGYIKRRAAIESVNITVAAALSFIDVCQRYVSHLLMFPDDMVDLESEFGEVERHVDALRHISEMLQEDTIWMTTTAEAVDAACKRRDCRASKRSKVKSKKKKKSGDISGDVIDIFPVDKLAESLERVSELCTLCSRASGRNGDDRLLTECDACKLAKFCQSCREGKDFARYLRCHDLLCAPDKQDVVIRFLQVSPADLSEAHGLNRESPERAELRELSTSWLFHMIFEVKHEIAFKGEFEEAAAVWNRHSDAKAKRRKKKSSQKSRR